MSTLATARSTGIETGETTRVGCHCRLSRTAFMHTFSSFRIVVLLCLQFSHCIRPYGQSSKLCMPVDQHLTCTSRRNQGARGLDVRTSAPYALREAALRNIHGGLMACKYPHLSFHHYLQALVVISNILLCS